MATDPPGLMPSRLTLSDALDFFAVDLPRKSECDLARATCDILHSDPSPLNEALAPLLRGELTRRQAEAGPDR